MNRLRGFETISKYDGVDLVVPKRATTNAAGYDIAAAEDIILEPYGALMNKLFQIGQERRIAPLEVELKKLQEEGKEQEAMDLYIKNIQFTTEEVATLTKELKIKPTLVPTGIKAYMQNDEVLKLFVRSSSPLKYWIVMANSTGIIDADYYNNPDNEGHIFFQLINLSPFPIVVKKGEILGQGIFEKFLKVDNDDELMKQAQTRSGGFGSTTK